MDVPKKIQPELDKIDDLQTRQCAISERSMLKTIGGDCDTAVGVYANIENQKINLKTELFSEDGKERFFMIESEEKKSFLS